MRGVAFFPAAAAADIAPADCNVSTAAGVPSNDAATTSSNEKGVASVEVDGLTIASPPKKLSYGGSISSCKRRRIDSNEENIAHTDDGTPPACNYKLNKLEGGTCRKLNYTSDETDDSDDEEESTIDPIEQELVQLRQESILRKIQRLNYSNSEGHGDQLLYTCAQAKLFEYVKDYDVVAKCKRAGLEDTKGGGTEERGTAVNGKWKYRGSGCVKFIKCMEEGYNCGMIRAELVKNGTLEVLMCHELTHEEVVSMPASKRGKSYTWRTKDWAYLQTTRTFAIRFDCDLDALQWKTQLEQSKINNCRVRRGLDVPDVEAAVDDVCSTFGKLRTSFVSNS